MLRSDNPQVVRAAFDELVAAAVAGKRCPINGDGNMSSDVMGVLARSGKVRVEISGRNYRQVFITDGPAKGYATAPNPNASHRVWLRIDRRGTKRVE